MGGDSVFLVLPISTGEMLIILIACVMTELLITQVNRIFFSREKVLKFMA